MPTRRFSGTATSSSVPDNGGDHSGGGGADIEDVFSTYVYTGTSAIQPIVNGVDLDGEGGLVWTKTRGIDRDHILFDTERGGREYLSTNNTNSSSRRSKGATFNSDGFTLDPGDGGMTNFSGRTYASWTFRKAPKYFDCVTYTGDGVGAGREIPHGLGCRAGMVIIKRTDASSDWVVQHIGNNQSAAENKANYVLHLNSADARDYSGPTINFDKSYFNVVGQGQGIADFRCTNLGGAQYVAYVFAHDESDESSNIRCGNFTTDGDGNATVFLGWEPQFLLRKQADGSDNWNIADVMRGFDASNTASLYPNTEDAEYVGSTLHVPNVDGFEATAATPDSTYIYVAIRKPNTIW